MDKHFAIIMTLSITAFRVVTLSNISKLVKQLVNGLADSKEQRTGENLINILPAS